MDLSILQKALDRERKSRKHAERLLEEKSRELYESFQSLEEAHEELKQNQRQLVQSEKMASLGVLSAGVAHEINNPIGFVSSNLSTLSEYVPVFYETFVLLKDLLSKLENDPGHDINYLTVQSFLEDKEVDFLVEDTAEILAETREGLTRVTDIVAGLQTFARAEKATMEEVDIVACMRSTASLVKADSKHSFEIIDELCSVPTVMGNTGKLGQVFMNLIVNAVQAVSSVKEDGRVTLRSSQKDRFVCVEVCDDGPGMSESVIEKIFEPFYTTKAEGEGTGLGLSLTQGIIDEHGGRIELSSKLGEGSTFTIALPVHDAISAAGLARMPYSNS